MSHSLEGAVVLVTGGAGLIGSHIVDRLVDEGAGEIRVLDNLVRGRRENLAGTMARRPIVFLEGDVRDRGAVGRGLVARVSDLSFGIYLAHPFVLTILLMNGLAADDQHVPAVVAASVAFVVTAVGATLVSFVVRRTPLSLPLTGRPNRRAVEQASSASAQAVSSALAPSTGTIAP